jgi:hypothetical protein
MFRDGFPSSPMGAAGASPQCGGVASLTDVSGLCFHMDVYTSKQK